MDYNKILVVEDDKAMSEMLSEFLSGKGYIVDIASNGQSALSMAREGGHDIILTDVVMPKMDGVELLKRLRVQDSNTLVIMMSAYGTIDSAVEAMKLGAFDYVSKPFKLDEILLTLNKARESRILRDENLRLRRELEGKYRFHDIIGRSPKMLDLFETVRKVSAYSTGILITGESGTGKELVARAIHYEGGRKEGPFVAVNLAAVPENLLESELFGHVKGAFTDATRDKPGLFEEAHNGTLFLDEIGELPQALQVKLLRALQEGEIRRIGSTGTKRLDVRIISATAIDIEEAVKNGDFRDDLYYRLNVVPLKMLPLREKIEDVVPLVEHFISVFNKKLNTSIKGIEKGALAKLMNYSWPGNVRELENCIERAMILTDSDTIGVSDLPGEVVRGTEEIETPSDPSSSTFSIKKASRDLEKRLILAALKKTGGNQTRAAELLEISYRALLYKLKDYNIDNKGRKGDE
ncbi:MAG: sigma-54-dependent Fis family transcriptional regulator [Deltaproteobacteria bacterium]|uniref:Sigma-54-dependent Fis family transcriptional regulator n=1 Tax=Candidatus Zymogenus saltonus TaxID=2844893 RepID=A0A9D8KJ40_9DELT|nr:sigma-54-dependent Fis family transcriptional regulator [Candidatus Zymogenus saltonus]